MSICLPVRNSVQHHVHLRVNTTLPKWENKLYVTTVIPIPLRARTQGHGYVKQNNEQFPGLNCNQFVINFRSHAPIFFPLAVLKLPVSESLH